MSHYFDLASLDLFRDHFSDQKHCEVASEALRAEAVFTCIRAL